MVQTKNKKQQKNKAKSFVIVPNVSLTARDKNRISKILSNNDLVFKKTRDNRSDLVILSVDSLKHQASIKYEMCEQSYYAIILNGNVVADIDWVPSARVDTKGQRIFDTIALIENKFAESTRQRV